MQQVEKIYQYLTDMAGAAALNVEFVIDCGSGARGIYLRELHEVSCPSEFSVAIEPKFMESRTGLLFRTRIIVFVFRCVCYHFHSVL